MCCHGMIEQSGFPMDPTSPLTLSDQAATPPAPAVPLAELDRDPHTVFRRLRPLTPLIRRDDGSYIAIRAADVERLITDPRTRQLETEFLRSKGINAGA